MERFAYTLPEVAEATGIALNAIEKGCLRGEIPHSRYGRARVMTPAQIQRFLAAHEAKAGDATDELEQLREDATRRRVARRTRRAAA